MTIDDDDDGDADEDDGDGAADFSTLISVTYNLAPAWGSPNVQAPLEIIPKREGLEAAWQSRLVQALVE